jgi:hypothetical protein
MLSSGRRTAVLLACLAGLGAAGAQDNPLVGSWLFQGQGLEVRLTARADGTYQRTVKGPAGEQADAGSYRLQGNVLELRPQGGAPEQFMVQMADKDHLQIANALGQGFVMQRQAAAPAATAPAGAGGAAPAGSTPGFKPPLPLPKAPGGHIIYTRTGIRTAQLPGLGPQQVPVPQLYAMRADGTGKAPFLAPPDFTTVKEARWSPDYKRLVFCSDWMLALSVCQQDIFVVNADGTGLRRVTGNELRGPAPKGYGAVTGVIRVPAPNPAEGELGINRSTVNITAQGSDGLIHHPGDPEDIDVMNRETRDKAWTETQMRFFLPKVAAGDQVWIKLWRNRYEGTVTMAQVKPNIINDVGDLELGEGTYHAFRPSIGPDAKCIVGMGSIAGKARNVQTPIQLEGGGGRHDEIGGVDAMTVYDFVTGTFLASLDPLKMQLHFPKDPAVSPDGQVVACAWGQPTTESLALIPLADLAAMRPNFRELLKGQMVLPDAVTTFQGTNVSFSSPCWSPDGRLLCCARTQLISYVMNGDLCLVGSDGSNPRQITKVGPNAIAGQPCFSPDGKQVAFTVISGKAGPIKIEDLVTLNITANIYALELATGLVRQLTDDGVSAEPAWGP